MRFKVISVTSGGAPVEVDMVGEKVEIPSAPGEVFAVHPTARGGQKSMPFTVTHVESGLRLGFGATLRGAVLNATNNAASVSPELLAQRIAAGNSLRKRVRNQSA